MRFLLLALGGNSWGRGAVGQIVATALGESGHEITVAAHRSTALMFSGTGLRIEEIGDHLGPLAEMYLDGLVEELSPDAILFCDVPTADTFFSRHGIYRDHMSRHGVPLVGIDLWDYREAGMVIDRDLTTRIVQPNWIAEIPHLLPVPILRPNPRPGAFACLPEPAHDPEAARKRWRDRHGIANDIRTILFCTGTWQEASKHTGATRRLAEGLPEIVKIYMQRLGPEVQFVHIGPAPWQVTDWQGYRWLPPVSFLEFEETIHGADLFLSANVAATTMVRAIVAGVPVALLQNSYRVLNAAHLPVVGSSAFNRSISSIMPFDQFRLWPLNYAQFLEPILSGNPYLDAFATFELLHEEEVVEGLKQLLYDTEQRDRMIDRQRAYVDMVKGLPKAGQALEALLANEVKNKTSVSS